MQIQCQTKNPSNEGFSCWFTRYYCSKVTPPTVDQAPFVMVAPVATLLVVYCPDGKATLNVVPAAAYSDVPSLIFTVVNFILLPLTWSVLVAASWILTAVAPEVVYPEITIFVKSPLPCFLNWIASYSAAEEPPSVFVPAALF